MKKLQKEKIIYYKDKEYPQNLKRLKKPPKQIYVLGNIELLNKN